MGGFLSNYLESKVSKLTENFLTKIFNDNESSINQDQYTVMDYINSVYKDSEGYLRYFYKQFYKDYNPDINGFILLFMIPPDLSGFKKMYNELYGDFSFFSEIQNFFTFSAVDFTPPSVQVNSEKISSRSGGIPYATEVTNTDQCSITFIENSKIDIYHFHRVWINYIQAVLEGLIHPSEEYLDKSNNRLFGAIDYASSLYVVKYLPNLNKILLIGKCIGIFPQLLPGKELFGQRTSNELTTLPINYFCPLYREATWREGNVDNWIFKEFNDLVKTKF